MSARRLALGLALACGGLSACAAGFADADPTREIPLDAALAGGLHIARVEVRSAFYNPRDAFHIAFEEGVLGPLSRCAAGPRPVTLRAWIHDLERSGSIAGPDGRTRLPGSAELIERGRVVARYRITTDIPTPPGGPPAQRLAAARAFGEALCAEMAAG